ncbi:MAG TPA: galactose-1-phosphate uridylyltransferase [bacterium]|nr:galactose-1-phosphate uridylyltransferase [bacterium]
MPELRKDPISGRWVIIATDRTERPNDFRRVSEARHTDPANCPFCPGNERETPHELVAVRGNGSAPDTPGWQVRAVPNRYPALRIEGDLNREGLGVYDKMNGVGAHEVIIETPNHDEELADLDERRINDVLRVCQWRVSDLMHDERFRYVLLFKNQGQAAGASLEHAHTQLIATPVVPRQVIEELEGARYYFNHRERCIFCDIVRQEISDGERLVDQTPHFVALSPYAARFPFETWILPRGHQPAYWTISEEHRLEFATILRRVLLRQRAALGDPSFNYMVHSSPFGLERDPEYHWHLEIIPRLTSIAGFEWGTGFHINPTSPEEAASVLRQTDWTAALGAAAGLKTQ